MPVQKLILQYYILSFLFSVTGIQVVSAIYVTFLLKNGLDLFEVNLVNAAYFLVIFVCEIPTGAFADIFGRKASFVLACAILACGMFVYGTSHTFLGFVWAEVILAFGSTFYSGAFKAWLVDSLRHSGYEGSCLKIFGRETAFNQIGGGVGAIAGAYLALKHPSYPWFVGGLGMATAAILALVMMREEYFVRGELSWVNGVRSMKEVVVTSFRYGVNHKAVRFILLTSLIQIYAFQALNMYWQPFFTGHGVSEKHLGFLLAAITVSMALGSFLVSRLESQGRERSLILLAMTYVGVMIVMAAISTTLPLILLSFLLHEVGRGFWRPISESYLQERIPSDKRATISSFCSFVPLAGGAIGLVVSGLIAQAFGIVSAWVVSGVVLVLGAIALRKNGKGS